MFTERTSVGLDVHARSIVACGLDTVTRRVAQQHPVPSAEAVLQWLGRLSWPVAVAYEAGPTGFGLAWQLAAVGVRCVVAAPSKLHRPAADRVKIDARDALHLARLLRMDQIVQVRVASPAQEAARDLVRAREDVRADLMRCRHRLSKLLLRHGILYSAAGPGPASGSPSRLRPAAGCADRWNHASTARSSAMARTAVTRRLRYLEQPDSVYI